MRRALFLIAALWLPALAAAETGTPVTMWMVQGKTNQVYLLGSVHLLRQSDYPLPDVFDRAYADAESIVMEIDMDDLDPVASQGAINRLGVLPAGTTLESVLGPRDFGMAQSAALKLDIPIDMLAQTEPWLAAMTIQDLILTRLGFSAVFGIEINLLTRARNDSKDISGLETFEQQLGFLDGLSPDTQRDWLLETLNAGADAGPLMEEMIAAWKTGDVDALEATMMSEFENSPELYRVIVRERNERWLAQIEPLFEADDDILVVVGALHLVGQDGLPQKLKARGLDIRQLSTDSEVPLN